MDRLISIPERVLARICEGKQLTPISPDVFISIPKRVSYSSETFFLGASADLRLP
jgi:hypothetical protein